MIASKSLSLSDLEAYDGQPAGRGAERRFLCPECGDGKKRNNAHRSMAVNTDNGAYVCHRCHTSGKLTDFWQDRPQQAPRNARGARLRRAFDVQPIEATATLHSDAQWLKSPFTAIGGTPGAGYLNGRGISEQVAALAGSRYCPSWFGRPAVVFPMFDLDGNLIAANGRYLDGRDNPKTRTAGEKSHGLFCAPAVVNGTTFEALDKRLPAIILTEAPIDALSLAACGWPAVAFVGTSPPVWLQRACGLRRVLCAFDDDESGETAAHTVTALLAAYGARCERLRPGGAKDWNELLLKIGADALNDFISGQVL
jgi:predicted RNA-binding Zn-ribbon protein involved in translation (DUF1610 family)